MLSVLRKYLRIISLDFRLLVCPITLYVPCGRILFFFSIDAVEYPLRTIPVIVDHELVIGVVLVKWRKPCR